MNEFYKISSTERVQQLEKELAVQLEELKTEIEDNGVLQGTPDRAYSSVPISKDASYFRKEREVILKKGLQVAEAKPLVVQADVIQRELESCLRREYTTESLPLLLHQFFTDRITHLVQSKYLYMLRWKRFCRHSSVIEQLYPLYQKQIGHIMQEYNDAVQRAARLSAARQNFLTGRKNSVNKVTQEDLVIYMQWLVCHLHSLKAIHSYLRVLQYLPISRRMEVVIEKHSEVAQDNGNRFRNSTVLEYLSSNIHFSFCPSISGREGVSDPAYVVNFKNTFTADLAKCKEGTSVIFLKIAVALDSRFKNLKCLPNSERDKVWSMLSEVFKGQHFDVETTEPEPPKKNVNLLLVASDSDN